MNKDVICGDANQLVKDIFPYHFSILSSSLHMIWLAIVGGKIKSDFRYSNKIVYNNFPWCNLTDKQKEYLNRTAQDILNAREKYQGTPFSKLYGKNMFLFADLLKAHKANDEAVLEAYGLKKDATDDECIRVLMGMYNELTKDEVELEKKPKKSRKDKTVEETNL